MTQGEFEMLLTAIARVHLHVDTLETRHSDRLDFHDCAVWVIRDALEAAFDAGVAHGRSLVRPSNSDTAVGVRKALVAVIAGGMSVARRGRHADVFHPGTAPAAGLATLER